jgi:penicillin amidase
MKLTPKQMLSRLGAGESIASVSDAAGISRGEFDAWWQQEIRARAPEPNGFVRAAVRGNVEIARDRWGIPHILADRDDDLFFAFGFAMAQDRLFQLDYLRRKGTGRLAEVLGPSALELDVLARTVGLPRIARDEWALLAPETRRVVDWFSSGINAQIEACHGRLPIEFDLLDYRPEPWSPIDCLAIEAEFRWYLTGRFPVIVMPELVKRRLGPGALYQAFLTRESDTASVLRPGEYATTRAGVEPLGPAWGQPLPDRRAGHSDSSSADSTAADRPRGTNPRTSGGGDPHAGTGSNNWVVAGSRTTTGRPLLASDPHIAIEAVSCWYEVHLCGGGYNVAGMAYVGMPAVMFGRTERVAWGCTNNICSQRDLYQERTDAAHPDSFLYDGRWEPSQSIVERIEVKGAAPVHTTVRFSRNGPIVDAVLPAPARATGPVSLRWLGAHGGGCLTALLGVNRATSLAEFRAAIRPWIVPTWNLVVADADGQIGYQMTGRIPIRRVAERGYRPGWDPQHAWDGLIPFDAMPSATQPQSGWITSANHRPAPDDFPYPLSGTWTDDLRGRRVAEMIEARPQLSVEHFGEMHRDSLSLRATRGVPLLLGAMAAQAGSESVATPVVAAALRELAKWDFLYEPDRTGAAIFEAFFARWCDVVTSARFDGDEAALVVNGIAGVAAMLLAEDAVGWFARTTRERAIVEAFGLAVDYLTTRLGPDCSRWTWGSLHTLPLRHVLSGRGDLGQLLDHGGKPTCGAGTTVCNTWPNPDFTVRSGAGYRLIADMSTSPPGLWAIDVQSQSGHPGSPHYSDQLDEWIAGRYHYLPLDRQAAAASATSRFRLAP